jgi:hypothetical protein
LRSQPTRQIELTQRWPGMPQSPSLAHCAQAPAKQRSFKTVQSLSIAHLRTGVQMLFLHCRLHVQLALNALQEAASPALHDIFQAGQLSGATKFLQQSSSISHCTRKHCLACTAMLDSAGTQRFMMQARLA